MTREPCSGGFNRTNHGDLLIVLLLVFGTIWIMANLDHRAMTVEQLMRMQR